MRLAVGTSNGTGSTGALKVYNLAGTLLWEALPDVGSPTDIYVRNLIGDSAGNIYVAGEAAPDVLDGTSYNVRRISPDGDIDWRLFLPSGSYSYSMAILGSSLYIKAGTTLYQISLADGTIQHTASPGVADGNVFVGPGDIIYAYGKVSSDYRYTMYNADLSAYGDYTSLDDLFHMDADGVGYQRRSWRVEKYTDVNSYGSLVWSVDHDAALICSAVDASGNVYAGTALTPSKKAIFKYNGSGVEQWTASASGTVTGLAIGPSGQVYSTALRTAAVEIATVTLGSWTLGAGWTNSGTRLEAAAETFTAISNDATVEIGKYYAIKTTVKRLEITAGYQYTLSVGGVSHVGAVTNSDVTATVVLGPTTTTDALTIIAYNPAYPESACRASFLISAFAIAEVESGINTVRSQNSDGSTAWAINNGGAGASSIALVEDPPITEDRNPYFFHIVQPMTANRSHSFHFI